MAYGFSKFYSTEKVWRYLKDGKNQSPIVQEWAVQELLERGISLDEIFKVMKNPQIEEKFKSLKKERIPVK